MTKRSRTAALAIVGAASFALAGCREEPVDSFPRGSRPLREELVIFRIP